MAHPSFLKTALAAALALALAACGGSTDAGTSVFGSGSGSTTTGGSSGTGTGAGTGTGTGGTTGGSGSTAGPTAPSATPGGGVTVTSSTGQPNQRFMSLSQDLYALNWDADGKTSTVTVHVADSAGNPVPEGTPVQFSASGGQIQTSCTLKGKAAGASVISECAVTFSSQNFRPHNGIVRILAWLPGEEAYKDANGNGAYDAGEPFADAGALARDDNDDGVYTPSVDELIAASSSSGDVGIGTSACNVDAAVPLNQAPLSVPATCDGKWGKTMVRASLPAATAYASRVAADFNADGTMTVYSTLPPPDDKVRVSAVSGTKITVDKAPQNCEVFVSPDKVPDTSVYPTKHAIMAIGTGCGTGEATRITLDSDGHKVTYFVTI